jgi:hypothetical protein
MPARFHSALFAVALVCADSSIALANPISRPAGLLGYPRRPLGGFVWRRPTPPGPPIARARIGAGDRLRALAGGWQRVAAPPPFFSAGHALLMTNGEVLIQSPNGSAWYGLVPDDTGNYVKGTWKQQASLPAGYSPLYYASAVLPDGRVIINGGEYNGTTTEVWTNKGAIYDLETNTWTVVKPPTGWTQIGDAPSVVLADGTSMLGSCCSKQTALFNESTLTWTATGSGKADSSNEEGWTLLPSGKILTADVEAAPNSELYNPATGFWTGAGSIPVNLIQAGEIGPQILRQNGHVFVVGADGHTAKYIPSDGLWYAGPALPIINGQQVDSADGPAALLTNGDVVMATSPGVYNSPSYFLDFSADSKTLEQIPGPPNAPNNSSYNYNFLLLPTGQLLETDFSNDVEILTPQVTANSALAPVITSVPTTLDGGSTYTVSGTLFNGVSQGTVYGDDAQQATNFPLVVIVNNATGHVQFARTHAFSSMAVASPAVVSTEFDVPGYTAKGASRLIVVANGIQSKPVAVTVK